MILHEDLLHRPRYTLYHSFCAMQSFYQLTSQYAPSTSQPISDINKFDPSNHRLNLLCDIFSVSDNSFVDYSINIRLATYTTISVYVPFKRVNMLKYIDSFVRRILISSLRISCTYLPEIL